jgi:hypothetical protein
MAGRSTQEKTKPPEIERTKFFVHVNHETIELPFNPHIVDVSREYDRLLIAKAGAEEAYKQLGLDEDSVMSISMVLPKTHVDVDLGTFCVDVMYWRPVFRVTVDRGPTFGGACNDL